MPDVAGGPALDFEYFLLFGIEVGDNFALIKFLDYYNLLITSSEVIKIISPLVYNLSYG